MLEYLLWGKPELSAKLVDSEIPKPGPKDVLIKVVAIGLNPKDWMVVGGLDEPAALNAGDDVAGIVEAVGSDVFEYKAGDRVAALHPMMTPHGTYAEYTVVPANTTFHLPPNISFEAGAGLPLCFMTASLALYQQLRVPLPTVPGQHDIPIVIYGGASAVGAYALQLAKLSKLSTIIAVAGAGIEFVESLGAATHIVDYRKGNVVADILAALGGKKLGLAFDVICGHGSYEYLSQALLESNGGGRLDLLTPPDASVWTSPEGVMTSRTMVGSAYGVKHADITDEQAVLDSEFAYFFYRYLSHLLAVGKLQPHPHQVLPDGLDGILNGVKALQAGKVSAKKLVARLVDCSLGARCSFTDHFPSRVAEAKHSRE